MTAIQQLNNAKADNYILYGVSAFLLVTGTFGVYGSLSTVSDTPYSHELSRASRTPRSRRRDLLLKECSGSGMKKNNCATAK